MDCKECGRCTYTDVMTKLCLDEDARKYLLQLIEEGIRMQMDIENFLHDRGYTENMIKGISEGVSMHFDCLLPNKSCGKYIRE